MSNWKDYSKEKKEQVQRPRGKKELRDIFTDLPEASEPGKRD